MLFCVKRELAHLSDTRKSHNGHTRLDTKVLEGTRSLNLHFILNWNANGTGRERELERFKNAFSAAFSVRFLLSGTVHAVQFGNHWMRKILRTAYGLVQLGSPRNFLNPIISKLDKHVVLLPINYRASKNSLFKAKLNVRAKTIQFILKLDYPIYFKLDSLQKLICWQYWILMQLYNGN